MTETEKKRKNNIKNFFHPMVTKLEYLHSLQNIKILQADFANQNIIITFKDPIENFDDMLQRIKFFDMTPRIVVKNVDFVAGTLTVEVLNKDKNWLLTKEEKEMIKNNKKIEAIRMYRMRTGASFDVAQQVVQQEVETIEKEFSENTTKINQFFCKNWHYNYISDSFEE